MFVSAFKTDGPPSDFHGEKKETESRTPIALPPMVHVPPTNSMKCFALRNLVLSVQDCRKKKTVSSWSNSVVVRYLVFIFFRTGHWSVFLTLSCFFHLFVPPVVWAISRRIFQATQVTGVRCNQQWRWSELRSPRFKQRQPGEAIEKSLAQNPKSHSPSFEVPDRRHLVDIVPEMFVFCGWKGKLPLNQRWILIEIKPTICQQSSSLQWSWRKTWTSWAPATSLWPLAGCRSTASKWHVSQMPFQGINILRLIPKGLQLLYSLKYTFLLRQINSCITLRKGMRKYLVFVKNVMAVICV